MAQLGSFDTPESNKPPVAPGRTPVPLGAPGNPQAKKDSNPASYNIVLGAGLSSFAATDLAYTPGGLFTADLIVGSSRFSNAPSAAIGAWYFSGGNQLWEFHARYSFRPSFGIQVGFLKTPVASNLTDWDAFAYYRVRLDRPRAGESETGWLRVDGTTGVGPYYYDAPSNPWQITAFGQIEARLTGGFGLQASYWFIKSPVSNVDINRVALTVIYRF